MRESRLGLLCFAVCVGAVTSSANAQLPPPPPRYESPGQVLNGPTSPNFGFPKPAVEKPSTWTNPFAQAANAFQSMFRSPPQYRSAIAPGDPTSLSTAVPEISTDVHLQAARLAFSRNRLADAKTYYERVLAANPGHLESLISLARIADSQTGFATAQPWYVKALKAHGNRAGVHNDFGMSAARNQRLDIAVMAFAEAVRIEPKSVRYRNNYAKALMQTGRTREALSQLVAVHPPAAAHYNFAFLLDQLGGPDEQILFHARQSLRFDPKFAAAKQLADVAAQRQLAMQARPAAPTGRTRQNVSDAPYVKPGQPAVRTAPYVTSQPPTGVRQSRRLPNSGETMFPPRAASGGRAPVYLPPAAPAWPRR